MRHTIKYSQLHQIIAESVKKVISEKHNIQETKQPKVITESQLKDIINESVKEIIKENQQMINEGKLKDFINNIRRNSDDITMKTCITLLWLLLAAHTGLFGYSVYERNNIIKQCREEFIDRYQVDPDTLQPGDERLKDFANYELEKFRSKGFAAPKDYKDAYNGGKISMIPQ